MKLKKIKKMYRWKMNEWTFFSVFQDADGDEARAEEDSPSAVAAAASAGAPPAALSEGDVFFGQAYEIQGNGPILLSFSPLPFCYVGPYCSG